MKTVELAASAAIQMLHRTELGIFLVQSAMSDSSLEWHADRSIHLQADGFYVMAWNEDPSGDLTGPFPTLREAVDFTKTGGPTVEPQPAQAPVDANAAPPVARTSGGAVDEARTPLPRGPKQPV